MCRGPQRLLLQAEQQHMLLGRLHQGPASEACPASLLRLQQHCLRAAKLPACLAVVLHPCCCTCCLPGAACC